MRIDIVTLFPGMFAPLEESILRRAQNDKILQVHYHDLRAFGHGPYRQVDDTPYGGGAGMLLKVDVIVPAMEAIIKEAISTTLDMTIANPLNVATNELPPMPYRIYLSPRGERLVQSTVEAIAKNHTWLLIVCGHYEGIDQRIIDDYIDAEISIGDFVLTGGELPAMVLIDAVARHIPGVLGSEHSAQEESFSPLLNGKKEYPHYTRPEEFRGKKVPEVLISGHHAKIAKWRLENTK